ncbi:MAG: hypothetical protein PQJ46_12290, partial [Spirochaetales bacterium]|nr:hypothetical protein [Spirochaetales bacterium]
MNFINNANGSITAELSVMFVADDDDGFEDIESFYVINDKHQVYWNVDCNNWITREVDDVKWIGYEHFITDSQKVPRPGTYRILVIDKAGERVEDSIYIPLIKKEPSKKDFPEIRYTDSSYEIEIKSKYNNNTIAFYDEAGKLIDAFSVSTGKINIKDLKKSKEIIDKCNNMIVSSYSNKYGAGLISKKLEFNKEK